MQIVYDIETESLDPDSKIWCLALSVDGKEPVAYVNDYDFCRKGFQPISSALELMSKADELWGWNNIAFDSVVLERQYGFTHKNERDGLILARLIWSQDELKSSDYADSLPKDLVGSYSLEAFGLRIGYPKIEHIDFSKLTSEMIGYCKQDVRLTSELINEHLLKADYQPPENVIKLEEETAKIIASQEVYGWNVNLPAVQSLKLSFEKQMFKQRTDLRKVFKPKFLADGKPKIPKRIGIRREFHTKIVDNFTEDEDE